MTKLKLSKFIRPIKSIRKHLQHQNQYVRSLEKELVSLRLSTQNQR